MLVWRVVGRLRKEAVVGMVTYPSPVNITPYWGGGNWYDSKEGEEARDGAKGVVGFKLWYFTSSVSGWLRAFCVEFRLVRAAMYRKRIRFWQVSV